jgi:hypothetical protein
MIEGAILLVNSMSCLWRNPHNLHANLPRDFPMSGVVHRGFQVYNASCFAPPGSDQYGTVRSVARQQSTFGTNVGSVKNISILEHQELQVRLEAFDVFNHPPFSFGKGSITSPTLGLATYQANFPIQCSLRCGTPS